MMFPEHWFENDSCTDSPAYYLLIEMGGLTGGDRNFLCEKFSGHYWPLIQDGAQPHLIRNGPWLYQVSTQEVEMLARNDRIYDATYAWIESVKIGQDLSRQLAPAMKVVSPEGCSWGLRFYHSEIINVLATEHKRTWHKQLFDGISAWYYESGPSNYVNAIHEPPKTYNQRLEVRWQLTSDRNLWEKLVGDTEVNRLLAEFENNSDLFEGLQPKQKRNQISDALRYADDLGLSSVTDRRTIVYLYLSSDHNVFASPEFKAIIQRAAAGEEPLLKQLSSMYPEV